MCLSFKILNLFGILSSWGSSNYRPSAPFLYEVASHVKNCYFGDYYYYYSTCRCSTPTTRSLHTTSRGSGERTVRSSSRATTCSSCTGLRQFPTTSSAIPTSASERSSRSFPVSVDARWLYVYVDLLIRQSIQCVRTVGH